MTWFQSISLAVLSFIPLWVLIFARGMYKLLLRKEDARIAEMCAVFGIPIMIGGAAVLAYLYFKNLRHKEKGTKFKIQECKEEKTVTIEFLAANVFPLLCFDTTSGEGLALTLTYFLVIASISVRHKYFPANIWLEWLGWTFWKCKVSNIVCPEVALERVVVSRNRVVENTEMAFVSINNETLIDFYSSVQNR